MRRLCFFFIRSLLASCHSLLSYGHILVRMESHLTEKVSGIVSAELKSLMKVSKRGGGVGEGEA